MSAELAILEPEVDSIAAIASACIARLSPNTQRAYSQHITLYLARGQPLTRESISQYLSDRKSAGNGPISINIALASLKLLAREVWIRGLLDPATYHAIADIRSEKRLGQRLGHWTDEQGVESLLAACDGSETVLRDRALIAVMCGCGLRRSEVAGLTWDHYQERGGRMCIVDLVGKGGRIRTVAIPRWVEELIEEYKESLQ